MRHLTLAGAVLLLVASAAFATGHQETVHDPQHERSVGFVPNDDIWQAPEAGAVLYDNGPLITCPGCGAGGADVSQLQDQTLGLNTFGYGHQVVNNNRVSDDFTVPAGETWNIGQITFFAYQSFAGNVSTITAVNLQIWDGVPGEPGSTVIFGDPVTNRLADTSWTNIYRTLETDLTNADRAIMANVVAADVELGAGTYWLDWQTDGSEPSGPWAPPISILGQADTGNARQSVEGGPYDPIEDVGNPQGFPFIIADDEPCKLVVDVGAPEVHAGEAIDLSLRLDHRRLVTVTVPFSIWIEDADGEIFMHRETGPRTYTPGDTLVMDRAITVPSDMTPGLYDLVVATDEMTQGEVRARVSFEVLPPVQ